MTDNENNNSFSWIPVYRDIAKKLIADYRAEISGDGGGENRKQQERLIALLRRISEKHIYEDWRRPRY